MVHCCFAWQLFAASINFVLYSGLIAISIEELEEYYEY